MKRRTTELTVLACTRIAGNRCCLAGIDSDDRWIRPGQPLEGGTGFHVMFPDQLWDVGRFVGGSLDVLGLDIDESTRRSVPHVEDRGFLGGLRRVGGLADEKQRPE